MRIGAVRDLPGDARDLLLEIARSDPDAGVQRAAVERMPDLATLVAFLQDAGEAHDDARAEAVAAVRDTLIEATDAAAAVGALDALPGERELAAIARGAELEAVARAALERLSSDRLIGGVARRAADAGIALAAAGRLTDRDELLAAAVKADDRAVALAACDRLLAAEDLDDAALEAMSRQARHKGVARRARAALTARSEDRAVDDVAADRGVDLCAALERRAATVASLEEGRKALDEAVQRWAAVDGPIDEAVSERFAAARRALEDRLLALDATAVEARQAAAARTAAESARAALCERVEGLDGAAALDGLRQARAEWAALDVDAGADPELRATVEALGARFERAAAACEARHAALERRHERLRALETLAAEIEQVVAADDAPDRRARWRALDRDWRRGIAAVTGDGAPPDPDTTVALAALTRRKAAADARQREREVGAKTARTKERQKKLDRAEQVADAVAAAIANEKLTLAAAERQLRSARQTLEQKPLSSKREHEPLARRLREGVSALGVRVRELRHAADWQRWANLGVQEKLCAEMEALASPPEGAPDAAPASTDDAEVARAFGDIMKRWRQAADVPQDQGQALWERFRKAHDAVYPRCAPFFEAERAAREQRLARRVALVEEAERLRDSTDWLKTAERLTALQAEWKTLGAAPRREQQALWSRLRKACSHFFTRRKADLVERKQEWNANYEKKAALCARVEALMEAEDLQAAIGEVKQVQREWKTIGAVRRSRSEAIWQRFRQACDGVFDRLNEGARRAAAERIAAREALCEALEALVPVAGPAAAAARSGSAGEAAGAGGDAPAAEAATAAETAEGAETPGAAEPAAAAASVQPSAGSSEAPAAEAVESAGSDTDVAAVAAGDAPAAEGAGSAVAEAAEPAAAEAAESSGDAPAAEAGTDEPAETAADAAVAPESAESPGDASAGESPAAAESAVPEAPPSPPAPEDVVRAVREVQEKWRRAPDVPSDVRRKLGARFDRAVARVVAAHAEQFRGTEHDPARRLQRFEKLCERVEALVSAASPGGGRESPAELLARKLRAQLAANTMGVGVDEQAKKRAAREDVKRLQAERRRLGALTGAEADALQARFQRACDRVFRDNPA